MNQAIFCEHILKLLVWKTLCLWELSTNGGSFSFFMLLLSDLLASLCGSWLITPFWTLHIEIYAPLAHWPHPRESKVVYSSYRYSIAVFIQIYPPQLCHFVNPPAPLSWRQRGVSWQFNIPVAYGTWPILVRWFTYDRKSDVSVPKLLVIAWG